MINFDTVRRMKTRRSVVVCAYKAVSNRIDIAAREAVRPIEMTKVMLNKSKEGTPEAVKRDLLARRLI
jgi:hypothetical protein